MALEDFPLPLETLLASTVAMLKEHGATREIAVVLDAEPELVQDGYDNWNGGTYEWGVELHIHHRLFGSLDAEKRVEVARTIERAASGFMREGHSVNFRLFAAPVRDTNWRDDAQAALAGTDITATNRTLVIDAPERQVNRRYIVGARIGEGALGEVWRANDTQLQREVAIKFIHDGASSEDAMAQARAVARVAHPNIVVVHEVTYIIDPTTQLPADAIVMELLNGTSLNDLVRYVIPIEEVRRVGVALLNAIGAYHQAQLAHLDLHGENVIIGDATVKVIDPSCARSDYFRSTSTRERQFARDVRDVRSLLVQMLHVSDGLPMPRIASFECDTATADLAALRHGFACLFVALAAPMSAPQAAVHPMRQQYERVAAAVTNREVVIAGGVVDAHDNRRNPVNGRIELGNHDEVSFELRIPAGAGPGIPLLRVPWEALRLPSVDAAGRLALALTLRVQWDGRELQLVAT